MEKKKISICSDCLHLVYVSSDPKEEFGKCFGSMNIRKVKKNSHVCSLFEYKHTINKKLELS